MIVINNKFNTFISNIEQHFSDSSEMLYDGRNKLKIVNFEDKVYVVKSFRPPHIINKIAYTFFRDSKAKKSYDNSVKIANFVPKAIGYIEKKKFGLIQNSYFICEYFKEDFTIREVITNDDFEDRNKIYKQFAHLVYELHNNNILHLDFSPGNILISHIEDKYLFKLIDINRMKFIYLELEQRLRNFAKLWLGDDDLKIIIEEYSVLINQDFEKCYAIALQYSKKHKDRINAKKRRRGQLVVD